MAARYQKYHLKWPLTPSQVINIDEMFSEIFTDLTNLDNVRRLVAGTGITFDDSIPGDRIINVTGGSSDDYVILLDGSEPPQIVSDGFGNGIYVPYAP